MAQKLRGVIMFGVACATSPCCTPFIIPALLVLLAGTPVAFWINQHIGWVYVGLTVISIISFALAYRWLRGQPTPQPDVVVRFNDIPVISGAIGEQVHVHPTE